jgi:hypothetical protein
MPKCGLFAAIRPVPDKRTYQKREISRTPQKFPFLNNCLDCSRMTAYPEAIPCLDLIGPGKDYRNVGI